MQAELGVEVSFCLFSFSCFFSSDVASEAEPVGVHLDSSGIPFPFSIDLIYQFQLLFFQFF